MPSRPVFPLTHLIRLQLQLLDDPLCSRVRRIGLTWERPVFLGDDAA